MDDFKLEDGKILVKCKNSMCVDGDIPDNYRDTNSPLHKCSDCKDGYQEYKEPEKPKEYNRIIHGQVRDYIKWIKEQKEYQINLSDYNEIKELLGVKKPHTNHIRSLARKAWKAYEEAQTRLEELYKEHVTKE